MIRLFRGFPDGSHGKESACNARGLGSIPGLGRSPAEKRKWQLTPVFLFAESHGQRSLAGYSPWGCVLKQFAETNKKTYDKSETSKSPKVQVEVPKKANNMFVSGLKSVGKFVVQHPIESLEIAGFVIVGAAKIVSSIKGSGSSRTHDTAFAPSSTNSSSVAEKVADIVEKASRSLPSENDVSGHKQRYHTKSGVVWKDKAPYHRGGK